jgi:hypothetical protein
MLLLIVATIFTLAFPVAAADGVTVMRLRGKYSPAFLIAAWTRSRLSCTAASGRPTMTMVGTKDHCI